MSSCATANHSQAPAACAALPAFLRSGRGLPAALSARRRPFPRVTTAWDDGGGRRLPPRPPPGGTCLSRRSVPMPLPRNRISPARPARRRPQGPCHENSRALPGIAAGSAMGPHRSRCGRVNALSGGMHQTQLQWGPRMAGSRGHAAVGLRPFPDRRGGAGTGACRQAAQRMPAGSPGRASGQVLNRVRLAGLIAALRSRLGAYDLHEKSTFQW